MKIKNIIFELGGVLIDFKPQVYLKHIGFTEEETHAYYRIVFCGEEWNNYNKGLYDENTVRETLINKYKEHEEEINHIFDNLDYNYILFLKEDTSAYLKKLKSRGYKIYILSDLSVESLTFNKQFDFFNYIDGGVYSFEVGATKPDRKNYDEILNRYNLKREESIFIDDNKSNVDMANSLGINGIRFDSLEEVKLKVEELLNN